MATKWKLITDTYISVWNSGSKNVILQPYDCEPAFTIYSGQQFNVIRTMLLTVDEQ